MIFESRIVHNFLSDGEIDLIESVCKANVRSDTLHYDNHQHSGHLAVTQSIFLYNNYQYQKVANILIPKLQQHFGHNLKLGVSHILNSYAPYGIHTDVMSAGFDPNGPESAAWTFIIPLDNYNSHTIVFEQSHEYIKTLKEWILATNAPEHEIDEAFYQKYLTHCNKEHLKYLKPESVFAWRKGDLFAADRRKFHVSDNFPAHNIACKRAIIIWSTVPK